MFLNCHDCSINIEYEARKVWGCNRYGEYYDEQGVLKIIPNGYIIDADYIDRHPLLVIFCTLSLIMYLGKDKASCDGELIEDYFDKYIEYLDVDGNTLFSDHFDDFKKVIDDFAYIVKQNGYK